MNSMESGVLDALIEYIQNRTNQAKEKMVSVLSQYISTSFYLGADKAAKEIGGAPVALGIRGLDPIIAKLGPHLDQTFGGLGNELTDIIKGGLKNGLSYDKVQKALTEKISAGWGKNITFDNVGKIRKVVNVSPNGTLSWAKQTISRKVTLPADVYAETLARTTMKQAYAQGHFSRYEQAGYPGWVYTSVADERTRPKHLALHGRIFLFGTPEEEMAREVMSEYGCRCRPKAYFGDPKLDRPDEEYREERRRWAREALDDKSTELPDTHKKFLEEVAGDADKEEVAFTPATTIPDAEKWVKELTQVKIADYKGIDVRAANAVNQSLAYHVNLDRRLETNLDYVGTCQAQAARDYQQRLIARVATIKKIYPEMDDATLRKLAEHGVIKAKVNGNTFAWSWRPANNAGIGINKKWGNNVEALEASLKRNVDVKFHPTGCDSIKAIIDHEFGHALDDLYLFRENDEILKEYKALCSLGNDKAKEALSLYAMTNRKEFIAEAWSEYLNNPKPRPLAKKIGGIIERTIKERKK